MSKIEDLIQQYCPNGVKYVKLGDVCEFRNGFAFKSNLFQSDGLPIVRITNITEQGVDMDDAKYFHMEDYPKTNMSVYSINEGDVLVAMSGATTGKIATYREKQTAYLNQRTGKFVPSQVLNNRFLFHFLLTQVNQMYVMAGGGAQPNLSSNDLKTKIEIPLPPLPVQEEIVRILDAFTELQVELQVELQARQLQYQYYRDQLLAFDGRNDIKEYTLGELFEFKNGLNASKEQFGHGKPIVNYVNVYKKNSITSTDLTGRVELDASSIDRYRVKRGDVFFTRTSETKEEIGIASVLLEDVPDCVFSGFVLRARPISDILLPEFCKYCFAIYDVRKQIIKSSTLTTRALTNGTSLSKVKIKVPSLEEQERIVSILDRFDALVNDLTQGLPAEIEARRQQYEYYRDQLLTFKRKQA